MNCLRVTGFFRRIDITIEAEAFFRARRFRRHASVFATFQPAAIQTLFVISGHFAITLSMPFSAFFAFFRRRWQYLAIFGAFGLRMMLY